MKNNEFNELELQEQIDQGVMPTPDAIYVPVGSMGTIVGLLLGCKIAGLQTKIIGIAVEPEQYLGYFRHHITVLFQQTKALLCRYAAACEHFALHDQEYELLLAYTGEAYGASTPEGLQAIQIAQQYGLHLDVTYGAKAFAGLLDQLKHHRSDENILFWHTFCGQDFTHITDQIDYMSLPHELHSYFMV